MQNFARLATRIRHSGLFENSAWLWDILRKPYHFLLNIRDKGVLVEVNDSFSYRIPPQYYYVGLADYERINMECLVKWIKKKPRLYSFGFRLFHRLC